MSERTLKVMNAGGYVGNAVNPKGCSDCPEEKVLKQVVDYDEDIEGLYPPEVDDKSEKSDSEKHKVQYRQGNDEEVEGLYPPGVK